MSDKLCELESLVNDAADCVRQALNKTCTFLTDERTGDTLPWNEMYETQQRLSKVLDDLQQCLVPIAPAITGERDHEEYLANLADGQSY